MTDKYHTDKFLAFDAYIPNGFIKQIKYSCDNYKTHLTQLKGMWLFYKKLNYNIPTVYLSKSRICVDNYNEYCWNPYQNGTIENLTSLLEKQFFDIVYLLLGGSYRPIHIILRYMLELTSWAAASIIDKKQLTNNSSDSKKAMSFLEFEIFLSTNRKNINKKMNPLTSKKEKGQLKSKQGLAIIPDDHIRFIHFEDCSGKQAIKLLHSRLSEYAHANIWYNLRSDEENKEQTGLYAPTPNSNAYHEILRLIIKVNEVIFYMLFVACYEDLIYFNKDYAKEFSTNIRNLTKESASFSLKFEDLEKITTELFSKQSDATDDRNQEKKPNPDSEELDEVSSVCSTCDNLLNFENELCAYCHRDEVGQPDFAECRFL